MNSKALAQRIAASPNRTPANTLIQSVVRRADGSVAYYTYRWNLRPRDPREADILLDPDNNLLTPAEARALATRGDAYRDYQRRTSAFVPWFPKA
jgi:hypothetical protein